MLPTGILRHARRVTPSSHLNRGRLRLAALIGIVVTGGAGSVFAAPSPAATVAVPAGNVTPNPSFEGTSMAGWSSWQGSVSRVALAGAPDGSQVARIAQAAGGPVLT